MLAGFAISDERSEIGEERTMSSSSGKRQGLSNMKFLAAGVHTVKKKGVSGNALRPGSTAICPS
jgi:hypothetical protein